MKKPAEAPVQDEEQNDSQEQDGGHQDEEQNDELPGADEGDQDDGQDERAGDDGLAEVQQEDGSAEDDQDQSGGDQDDGADELQRLREENIRLQAREEALRQSGGSKEGEKDPWEFPAEFYIGAAKEFGVKESFVRWIVGALKSTSAYSEGRVHSQYGEFLADKRVEQGIRELAKDPKFADARKYSSDIRDFLQDYPLNKRSDRKVLEKAFTYARGLHLRDVRKATRKGDEASRRVARGTQGPASGGGSKKGAKKPLKATPEAIRNYERFGKNVFGSLEEFLAYGEK